MMTDMQPSVLIFAARKKPLAEKARMELLEWLKGRSIRAIDVAVGDDLTKIPLAGVRLGVAIGGDGTFLALVRGLAKKDAFPLLGINLGTVGFITEVGADQMLEAVEGALSDRYPEDKRLLLAVDGSGSKSLVFNEVAIHRETESSMPRIRVSVDGELLTDVRADGFLVASPTGSTGHALSAGGPLLHPGVEGLVVLPICAHSLSSRPVIVPSSSSVELTLKELNGKASLLLDGDVAGQLQLGDSITVQRASVSVRLIRPPEDRWAAAVRTKLHMG